MFSVGETLQRARLEQGLAVATVAARTKINAKYLEAIEADDRGSLPSSFFYKSFVHQYARTLSLDTKAINAEIDRVLSADAPLPLPGQDNPTSREVSPVKVSSRFQGTRTYVSLAGLVLMMAACSGIYDWWSRSHSTPSVQIQTSTPVMENAKPQEAAQLPSVPLSLASASPAAGSKILLDLMAREATWLSVSSDGKPVFSGILVANQSKTVESKEYAKMRVGNAAGLEVRLNGKLLGPLGRRGQVLVVVFTPDNFQIMSPAKDGD
jgi:cytoskeletal protein RodZ